VLEVHDRLLLFIIVADHCSHWILLHCQWSFQRKEMLFSTISHNILDVRCSKAIVGFKSTLEWLFLGAYACDFRNEPIFDL
jgi:hypothetical protein